RNELFLNAGAEGPVGGGLERDNHAMSDAPVPDPTDTPTARSILRRSAPRVLRDALRPILSFFVGWKLAGLVVGIGLATAFAAVIYRHERRAGRPAIIVRVAFVLVLIRAVVGLTSGSARVYLGQ